MVQREGGHTCIVCNRTKNHDDTHFKIKSSVGPIPVRKRHTLERIIAFFLQIFGVVYFVDAVNVYVSRINSKKPCLSGFYFL